MSKGSKEYFILTRGIYNIKRLRKLENNFANVFYKLDPEVNSPYFSLGVIEKDQLEVLKMMFDDKDNWISYFIYDCDFGKKPLQVTLANGRKIKMKTVANLWDVIKNN